MSNKCKVLILGEKKAYADNEEKRNQQIQQIKDCKKQNFKTFKEKFNKGLNDFVGVVKGDKKISILEKKDK